MEKDPGETRKAASDLAVIGSAGLASGLALILCLLTGSYLDSKLGLYPVFTAIGLVLGIIASFVTLIKSVLDAQKNGKK